MLLCFKAVYHLDIKGQRWWHVVKVSLHSTSIYQMTNVHVMEEVGVETSLDNSEEEIASEE